MPWSIAAPIAGAVVSSALSDSGSSKGGGAGAKSETKEPWLAAQPWLMSNLAQGQILQDAYAKQPFSAAQNAAYNNQNNQSAYMGGLVPSLLGQISGQQVGFDRSRPNVRPNAYNFNGAGNGTGTGGAGGLLNMLSRDATNLNPAANTPQLTPAEAPKFTQQGDTMPQMVNWNNQGGDSEAYMAQMFPKVSETPYDSVGSFGSFKYGMEMPKAGTQAYKDMSDYFAYGGTDPMNKYGRGGTANANPMANIYAFGAGNGGGGSVGGSPGSDGSGGGAPGVY